MRGGDDERFGFDGGPGFRILKRVREVGKKDCARTSMKIEIL